MAYNSYPDTIEHIRLVQKNLHIFINEFLKRSIDHDKSKLEEPEKSLLDTQKQGKVDYSYNSKEELKVKEKLTLFLDRHYKNNSHHPEHYESCRTVEYATLYICNECGVKWVKVNSVKDNDNACPFCEVEDSFRCEGIQVYRQSPVSNMNLFDIVEMLADWLAAINRHKDGNIYRSIEINRDRFGISPQLVAILYNTVKFLERKEEKQ